MRDSPVFCTFPIFEAFEWLNFAFEYTVKTGLTQDHQYCWGNPCIHADRLLFNKAAYHLFSLYKGVPDTLVSNVLRKHSVTEI